MDFISLILHHFLSFLLIISVIVFIHEYGHYIIAKWQGVKIEVFSIGMGKEVFGWTDRSGTRWKISAFPIGGYVKMFGDENAASVPDTEKLSKMSREDQIQAFNFKSYPAKAAIVIAGPVANFLLAIVIFTWFFFAYGKASFTTQIEEVIEGSPAHAAGLQKGDVVLSIDDEEMNEFQDIQVYVTLHPTNRMQFKIQRGETILEKSIMPEPYEKTDSFGNPMMGARLGISSALSGRQTFDVFESISLAVQETYRICAGTLHVIGQMIVGQRDTEELGGIIRIVKYSGQSTASGMLAMFWFMAVLSINLGLVNLFPIPLLDGGHLAQFTIEACRGAPLTETQQTIGFRVGVVVLIGLMIFATINDIRYMEFF